MAAKEKEKESTDAELEETPKKSKKKKIIVGVLCLVMAGGAYQFGVKSSAAPPAVLAPGETTTTTIPIQKLGCSTTSTEEAPLSVADLPSMSINLAEGHYLRIAISLALCDDIVLAEGEEFLSAPARDIVVSTLSGKSMAELTDDASRLLVKEELTEKISAAYPAEVYEVFFVEFVMQ